MPFVYESIDATARLAAAEAECHRLEQDHLHESLRRAQLDAAQAAAMARLEGAEDAAEVVTAQEAVDETSKSLICADEVLDSIVVAIDATRAARDEAADEAATDPA